MHQSIKVVFNKEKKIVYKEINNLNFHSIIIAIKIIKMTKI